MTRIEQIIHDNKVRVELIEDLIRNWTWEFENGYWKSALLGKLEGIKKTLEVLEKE